MPDTVPEGWLSFDLAPKGAKGLYQERNTQERKRVLISPPKGQKGYYRAALELNAKRF